MGYMNSSKVDDINLEKQKKRKQENLLLCFSRNIHGEDAELQGQLPREA